MSKKEVPVSSFVDIIGQIKTDIEETANAQAISILVEKRVKAEVDKRADILEKGLDMWAKLKSDLNKCQPDVVNHVLAGEDGEEFIPERKFSDAKYKELQGLKKKLVDLESAMLLAQGAEQKYDKLTNIVKGG